MDAILRYDCQAGWATTFTILAALVLMPAAFLSVLFAAVLCIAVPIALGLNARDRRRARRSDVDEPEPSHQEPTHQSVPLAYAKHPPPRVWTGATTRSMSACRVFNATDARSIITHEWRQIANRFPMPRKQR